MNAQIEKMVQEIALFFNELFATVNFSIFWGSGQKFIFEWDRIIIKKVQFIET